MMSPEESIHLKSLSGAVSLSEQFAFFMLYFLGKITFSTKKKSTLPFTCQPAVQSSCCCFVLWLRSCLVRWSADGQSSLFASGSQSQGGPYNNHKQSKYTNKQKELNKTYLLVILLSNWDRKFYLFVILIEEVIYTFLILILSELIKFELHLVKSEYY